MKFVIFFILVAFGMASYYLNFLDFGERESLDEKISERMEQLDKIDQKQIEIAFDDLVESAKKRFNGEFAFPGQKLLKGKIFPARGITQLENGKIV